MFPKELPITESGSLDIAFLEKTLNEWLDSERRKDMLLGEQYYFGKHDILNRQRMVINESGGKSPVDNLPNNKLIDNQYKKLVDQKDNYALGKPMTIATSDDTYLEELNRIFDKKMAMKMRRLGKMSINGGIAWLHPYVNENGELKFAIFPSYEVCPIWTDASHSDLSGALRCYKEQVYRNGSVETIERVELHSKSGVTRYVRNGNSLVLDKSNPHSDYLQINGNPFNWDRVPLIPFRYNADETPLINNVKCLQDSLNQVLSDFQNNLEEDPRNTILVIKNYDGTDLGSFRRNLATYGAVKVQTVDGVQGGIDTLKVDVNAQNYQAILMQLKRAIVENGRGFDAKEERMDGDPNQMNIESMYTDIDLDVDAMESEFQSGLEDLKWFIDTYLKATGKGDFFDTKAEFVFNRDIFINEDAIIDNCVKSAGMISNTTIISHHPWVTDVQREMSLIEDDKQKELEEMEAFNEVSMTAQNSSSKQSTTPKGDG